ncbi:Stp1/IreP family PP2C-type Ser/Thr phosphatase [Streptococcus jiangjianxini]|uniref:Stp1/IreP family PP2C-type Ser/Thr phosphatase n=1 Tax=Streptococcus jiangjianxini TaxID=3161189 RepID=UPI0032ED5350
MEISLLTDIGKKRSNNQDFVNQYKNQSDIKLVILADGMGGHRAGNIASEMAVTDLGNQWAATDYTDVNQIRDWMLVTIEAENQKIHTLGTSEEFSGMGTTIEVLAFVKDVVLYAHVGDSRISLIRDGQYKQLTSDHSLVNELVKAGQLTEEEAAVHPQKNVITQSIGQASPLDIDLGIQPLQNGDFILVNSDGLSNMVSRQQKLEIILSEKTVQEKVEALVDAANQAGGLDNITVVLIAYNEEDA